RATGMFARWNLGDKKSVGAGGDVQRMTKHQPSPRLRLGTQTANDEESPNAQMPNEKRVNCFVIGIPSSLDIRHSSFASEVQQKPIACELGDFLQRARFLKEMRGA